MTSPYPTPPFTVPSPSESSFSIPTTFEPVFSVATTEPVFESQTSHSAQPSQNTQPQFQQYNSTTVSSSNAKFPYLKKDEYETWAMKMEYWIMNSDHNLWNIVLHGNSRKRTGRDPRGNIMILPPVTMEEQIAVQRETKARTILLQSLPEDHMADFHHLDDAKDIWLAVKARFGGNEESKKMRKSMLKQEFADFKISESEGLHKGYDRFQKVLSQLNQMQARPDNEDCNMKFLRALPPSWSQVAITLKTKGGLDFLSFDDLYNKLRTLEIDVKGGSSYDSRVPAAPTHSAFISAASTNSKWSTADSKCQPSSVSYTTTSSSADASGNVLENVLHSFVAESDPQQQITYEDFDQIGKLDLEELDIKWQMAMLSVRINRFEKKAGRKFKFNNKDAARFDKKKVRCYQCSELGHFARECTGKKVDSKTRYSQFKIKELDKSEEPKALVSVDSMLNWSDHESEDMEKGASEVYGMIAGYGDDAVIPAVDAADGVSTDGIFADGVFVAKFLILNFHGDHMPLVAAMLPPPQAAIAAAAQLNKPVSKPPRPIPTSPSAQAPPEGPTLGGAKDLLTLTALYTLVSEQGKRIGSLESELQAQKLLFKDVMGEIEEDEEQDVDSLIKLAKAAAIAADASSVPADATQATKFPPSSSIYTDDFVHGNDVPTMEDDWLRKQSCQGNFYEEEQAMNWLEYKRKMKKKRQEDVINSAKYYTDADWSDIMGQVHANQGLTADLLGPDVNEDNFAERMVAFIAGRRRKFEAQRLQEKRNKPMTFAQQKDFMRTFVKNQSSTIYSTGWTLKYVKTFSDDQLKAEFDKIRNATADLQAQNLRRSLKRPGADVEPPGSKKSKSSATPQTPVPAATHQSSAGVPTNVHQSPFVDSPPSTPATTPDTSVDPPVSRSSGPRIRSHSSAAGITTYSTRRKSLATRKMSSSEVDLHAPDESFIQVLSGDDSDDFDDDTDPLFFGMHLLHGKLFLLAWVMSMLYTSLINLPM
ncbi:ribonuclease H-like domain-containing protein [Tanacetum coccineum]